MWKDTKYHVFKGALELLGGKDAPDILFEFVDWAERKCQRDNDRGGTANAAGYGLPHLLFHNIFRNEKK